jgi:hypothetical protein
MDVLKANKEGTKPVTPELNTPNRLRKTDLSG